MQIHQLVKEGNVSIEKLNELLKEVEELKKNNYDLQREYNYIQVPARFSNILSNGEMGRVPIGYKEKYYSKEKIDSYFRSRLDCNESKLENIQNVLKVLMVNKLFKILFKNMYKLIIKL